MSHAPWRSSRGTSTSKFFKENPEAYGADGSAPSRLDEHQLQTLSSSMPARRSHVSMKRTAVAVASDRASQAQSALLSQVQGVLPQLLEQLQRQLAPEPTIQFTPSHGASPPMVEQALVQQPSQSQSVQQPMIELSPPVGGAVDKDAVAGESVGDAVDKDVAMVPHCMEMVAKAVADAVDKKKTKQKPKTDDNEHALAKAKAKGTPKAKAKGKAKAKAQAGATAAAPKTTKLVLGCGKCRTSPIGCKQCRNPKYNGKRGPR